MKEEKALETVAFFDSASHPLFDLFFVHWAVLMVSTGPVVTSAWLIAYALPRLKDVSELAVEDFVVDHTRFHVDYDRARLQICYLRAGLQIDLAILTRVYVSEEAAQRLIV